MRREQLIGTWQRVGTRLGEFFTPDDDAVIQFNSDGTAALRGGELSGHPYSNGPEVVTWEHPDGRLIVRVVLPSNPDVPTFESGGVGLIEYDVVSFSDDRMELAEFDDECTSVWKRLP